MVLSVCRGILKDPNNAEDAFQATFLILVKKSGTFGGHVALGPWLLSGGLPRGDPGQLGRRPAAGMRKAGGTDGRGNLNIGAAGPPGRAVAGSPRRNRPTSREVPSRARSLRLGARSSGSGRRGITAERAHLTAPTERGTQASQGAADSPGPGMEGPDASGNIPPCGPSRSASSLGRRDRTGGAGHCESRDNRRGHLGGVRGIDS